jgi:hypothetical protein
LHPPTHYMHVSPLSPLGTLRVVNCAKTACVYVCLWTHVQVAGDESVMAAPSLPSLSSLSYDLGLPSMQGAVGACPTCLGCTLPVLPFLQYTPPTLEWV